MIVHIIDTQSDDIVSAINTELLSHNMVVAGNSGNIIVIVPRPGEEYTKYSTMDGWYIPTEEN